MAQVIVRKWKSGPRKVKRVAYGYTFQGQDGNEGLEDGTMRSFEPTLDGNSHSMWRRCATGARVVTMPGPQFLRAARREAVLAPGARVIAQTPTFVAVQRKDAGL